MSELFSLGLLVCPKERTVLSPEAVLQLPISKRLSDIVERVSKGDLEYRRSSGPLDDLTFIVRKLIKVFKQLDEGVEVLPSKIIQIMHFTHDAGTSRGDHDNIVVLTEDGSLWSQSFSGKSLEKGGRWIPLYSSQTEIKVSEPEVSKSEEPKEEKSKKKIDTSLVEFLQKLKDNELDLSAVQEILEVTKIGLSVFWMKRKIEDLGIPSTDVFREKIVPGKGKVFYMEDRKNLEEVLGMLTSDKS
jgi:hypothetical protein